MKRTLYLSAPAWINTRSGIRKGIRLLVGVVSQRNRCLRANIDGASDPYKACRSGAIAGRMACLLGIVVLACASVAQGQVIEEGGFPVKGGNNSGEAFSLSCPSRLVAQAGESVLLSCTARSVPEEGVRYEWESLSGDGLHLLSASDERSPLFTAPVSGENAEYAYRLTAMGLGIYRTATVTVSVENISGESSGAFGVQEECDPFMVPDELGEGCLEGKAPDPFGFGPEPEGGFLFPEAPGLPDRPSGPVRGGGSGRQAPPRLECPVAVFLEELGTGAIECHAWDAAGEEYLEYSWEPVGSTTRDYLDNPRLIPEDAPNPSVVAPEAPVYETLESFHSGETTFRYRYRLTATSRATGLSSSQEVEVYVSSSRPSVYCPLEVVVEEGETAQLDCEGVDPLSFRMDYDEEGASILWEWEGLWGTSTAPLAATHLSSPLFTAPAGSAGEEYHYIASMTSSASGVPRTAWRRVTVTVTGAEEGPQTAADDSSLMFKGSAPVVTCNDSDPVYEGASGFTLDCTVTDAPQDSTYSWTGTDVENRLTDTDSLTPTFTAPGTVDADTDYEYTVTLSASGVTDVTEDVKVTVLEKSSISCTSTRDNTTPLTRREYYVYEGDADLSLHFCEPGWIWKGAPGANPVYAYTWTARGSTPDTRRLSATNIEVPTFAVPDTVESTERYRYTLTVSAVNADDGSVPVDVVVFARVSAEPSLTCEDAEVYEGAADFTLDCSATDEPTGATYSWTGTDIASRLTGVTTLTPTFSVLGNVDADTDYEYTVTLSATGIDDVTEDITVTVKNKPSITLTCEDSPYEVDEGDADIELECEADGAPGDDLDYTWSWSPTTSLTGHNTATPTFDVLDSVEQDTTYTYTVTATADNADDGTAEVTVTVKDTDSAEPSLTCPDAEVYENQGVSLACSVENEPPGATYAWAARGNTTNTDLLSYRNGWFAIFQAPANVDADTDYEYTVTMSATGFGSVTEDITVTVRNRPNATVTCPDPTVYEGSDDFALDCEAQGLPAGATLRWGFGGGGAAVTLGIFSLSGNSRLNPTFHVPDNVDSDTKFIYRVQMDIQGEVLIPYVIGDVTITVLNKRPVVIDCGAGPGRQIGYGISENAAHTFSCSASGAPGGDPQYAYSWTARAPTPNTELLSRTDISSPVFTAPAISAPYMDFHYTVSATAHNAEEGRLNLNMRVTRRGGGPPVVACTDPDPVYEGSYNIILFCWTTDEPPGATYAWTARGSTPGTDDLSSTTILGPTFDVPDNVGADTDYEYTVTLSAPGMDDVTEDVTVTVKNNSSLVIDCGRGPGVTFFGGFEESNSSVSLLCYVSGAPGNDPQYTPVITARNPTPNTDQFSYVGQKRLPPDLIGLEFYFKNPFFEEGIDGGVPWKDFYYTITVTADNADAESIDIHYFVTNKDPDPPPRSPVVTCTDPDPLYEGSGDIVLDCTAANEPSDATYAWVARGSTSDTALLSATTVLKPTFDVPDNVSADTDYEYRVTLSAPGIDDVTGDVTVTVLNNSIRVTCEDNPYEVYEGGADLTLDCSASGAPGANPDYTYAWTSRGDTPDVSLLSAADIASPVFFVPDEVTATTTYEYLLTVSADNAESSSERVTVTVLKTSSLSATCADPGSVYEGSADIAFDCLALGAPNLTYVWTARGDTPDVSLLSAADIASPTFHVPEDMDATTTYEYLLTVSAANAEDATAEVSVTVLDREALSVVCADPPSVYEGSEDFDLDCSASGAPAGSAYEYAWTARGSTANTNQLSATDIASPIFYVPDELDATTTYEYLLTVSAENAIFGTAEVSVTVLNNPALAVVCANPGSIYEGSADFELDCSASGAPSGSNYEYEWTARGSTANTDQLSATDISSPTFHVPEDMDATTTYEYLLTVSAANAEDATAEVSVTVLDREALSVVCADPPSVYEGSEDFDLDCSASGAPAGSAYEYAWTARGSTANTNQLSATDIASPIFYVPDELDATTTYEYLLTVSAENAIFGTAEVSVTVLNNPALAVVCANPGSIYEGSADFELDCSASGAPSGSNYEYEWTARGSTANTDQLSATDISSPTFHVPEDMDATTRYEYLLTVSAANAEDATAEVSVTVLDREALSVVCADPPSVYEGSEDFDLDCSASGAPAGSAYEYAWTARGSTANTNQLSATDIASPIFYVPDELDATTTYEYLLTVSAENAIFGTAEVSVTVLNNPALAVVCANPGSIYEGSADFELDCSASGAPSGSNYEYEWTARGSTANTDQLSATDISSPTFHVPEDMDATTTYEYLLTVSAANAEDATAEVSVTVLDGLPLAFVDDAIAGRVYAFTVGETIADILLPEATGGRSPYTYTLTPVLPPGLSLKVDGDPTRTISGTPLEVSPRTEYTWQVVDSKAQTAQIAFFIEVVPAPVAELLSLGVTISASPLRFGVQSSDTQVSLDPVTDGISTQVSGPYHVGRMTLSPDGSETFDENGEMDVSIELASPVVLKRADAIEASSLVLSPNWSYAESCEQLSSQTIGGLYTEVTLSEPDCRLLRFGGELDLLGVASGRYAGSLDVILRSGESEETFAVEVSVTVVPAQRVITIGPGGVRFSTSRELPAGLTEEQNLSIYPDAAFLNEEKPNGVFELSNPSLIPLEISVSARFGYTEATENGREVVVEDASGSRLGDLSQVVDIHPGVLVLMPGEKGLIRYGVQEGALAAMAQKGYAAFFDVVSEPRQYVRSDQMPEEVTGDRTARVTMRVPGVYVPGEGASQLRARLLSISFVGSLSATFLVETQDHPFVGEVVAYGGDGRELGRQETLVYTRSRVRVPLSRMPEEGAVFLRFSPRGAGRVPEPASIEWDAPRRDIGAAEDKDRATTPEVLVQKP